LAVGFESTNMLVDFMWDLLLSFPETKISDDQMVREERSMLQYHSFVEKVRSATSVDFLGLDVFEALPISEVSIDWANEYLVAMRTSFRAGCESLLLPLDNVDMIKAREEIVPDQLDSHIKPLGETDIVEDSVTPDEVLSPSPNMDPTAASLGKGNYKTRGKRLSKAFLRNTTDIDVDDFASDDQDHSHSKDYASSEDISEDEDAKKLSEEKDTDENGETYEISDDDIDYDEACTKRRKLSKPSSTQRTRASQNYEEPTLSMKKAPVTLRQKLIQQMRSNRRKAKR
jgi:hypothetical protein